MPMPRALENALSWRGRLAVLLAAAITIGLWLTQTRDDPDAARLQASAQWEQRWISPLNPNICTVDPATTTRFIDPNAESAYRVSGGTVTLHILARAGRVEGSWMLDGVQAPWGWLHATAPEGFTLHAATIGTSTVHTEIHNGHLAIALDACTRPDCALRLDFSVEPGPGKLSTETVLLRAADLLPRLGLDGDLLLREPKARAAHGLPETLTLPDDMASVPMAGVAPAGQWRWEAMTEDALPLHGASGSTTGPLDFILAWTPGLQEARHDALTVLHVGASASDQATLADDLANAQACLSRRLGGTARIDTLLLAPWPQSGASAAHLAAGTLWLALPRIMDADLRIAMRRSIARRHVADTARLRQGRSAQWMTEGLPGAAALLCMAETQTPAEMLEHLRQAAARTDAALQAQPGAVGALAYAAYDGWSVDYAPLAALDSVRRLSPEQISTLLAEIGGGTRVPYAMANAMGVGRTTLALSMPLSTDLRVGADGALEGERWRWRQGQWRHIGRLDGSWPLALDVADDSAALLLDAWPAYERTPADNLVRDR